MTTTAYLYKVSYLLKGTDILRNIPVTSAQELDKESLDLKAYIKANWETANSEIEVKKVELIESLNNFWSS